MPVRPWLFWLPFVLGSGALVFAILLAQVPGKDRTLDLIVFSSAVALLAASLWLGFFYSNAPYRRGSGWTRPALQIAAATELVVAVFGAVGAATYKGM